MSDALIRVNGVNKTFLLGNEPVHALNNIQLQIQSGEYLSVMGPSGSGKSTLLNMLGLLDVPDNGEYWLAGADTVPMDEEQRALYRRQQIGFVFQSYHLIPRLSAAENIELPLILAGIAPAERKKRLQPIIEKLGLDSRAGHLPNQLSGGQRQRVAIGRAIIMKPHLLLADEPTGNLDSSSGAEVVALLEELNNEGITLVVVTHDADLGQRAKRRIRMVDGVIVQDEKNAGANA
ncbi:ABC transporter ATP-binding protein [Thalassolituus marinus]|uniref:ABC transporter ATP-binding protein n=1 Tax=Thalassolituus marinus TaxID=671053 RepID=A0ABS7ZR17_9GAMM|nr:ABC transporter ATP-binding protein [Thalassolituus marinus]MCA6064159.1 ABC transporter ATP-binding protein [Thalassolituus marinus]